MAALFAAPNLPTPPTPPAPPTVSDPTVTKAASNAVDKQAMAQGRASTYLTDMQSQRTPQPNAQRYLGMA